MSLPGTLLVFEGVDGAGKSTLIARLEKRLKKDGYKVTTTKWRNSKVISPYFQVLQKSDARLNPYAFSALHAANFADQVDREILPALRKGEIVLVDRYFYTQIVRDRLLGVEQDWTANMFPFAPAPDAIFHLAVAPKTAAARVQKRIAEGGRRGAINRSLKKIVAGGSILGTLGMGAEFMFQENNASGKILTQEDEERIKLSFYENTEAIYAELFQNREVVRIDAEREAKVVYREAWRKLKEILKNRQTVAEVREKQANNGGVLPEEFDAVMELKMAEGSC